MKDFNEDLLEFESLVNRPAHVTSNVLRHSFTSHMRNKRVEPSIIMEAIGHETEEQLYTYLNEVADTIVADEIEKEAVSKSRYSLFLFGSLMKAIFV